MRLGLGCTWGYGAIRNRVSELRLIWLFQPNFLRILENNRDYRENNDFNEIDGVVAVGILVKKS